MKLTPVYGGGRDGNPFCSGLNLMSWPRGSGVRCEPEQLGLKFRISWEQLTHVQDENINNIRDAEIDRIKNLKSMRHIF